MFITLGTRRRNARGKGWWFSSPSDDGGPHTTYRVIRYVPIRAYRCVDTIIFRQVTFISQHLNLWVVRLARRRRRPPMRMHIQSISVTSTGELKIVNEAKQETSLHQYKTMVSHSRSSSTSETKSTIEHDHNKASVVSRDTNIDDERMSKTDTVTDDRKNSTSDMLYQLVLSLLREACVDPHDDHAWHPHNATRRDSYPMSLTSYICPDDRNTARTTETVASIATQTMATECHEKNPLSESTVTSVFHEHYLNFIQDMVQVDIHIYIYIDVCVIRTTTTIAFRARLCKRLKRDDSTFYRYVRSNVARTTDQRSTTPLERPSGDLTARSWN